MAGWPRGRETFPFRAIYNRLNLLLVHGLFAEVALKPPTGRELCCLGERCSHAPPSLSWQGTRTTTRPMLDSAVSRARAQCALPVYSDTLTQMAAWCQMIYPAPSAQTNRRLSMIAACKQSNQSDPSWQARMAPERAYKRVAIRCRQKQHQSGCRLLCVCVCLRTSRAGSLFKSALEFEVGNKLASILGPTSRPKRRCSRRAKEEPRIGQCRRARVARRA